MMATHIENRTHRRVGMELCARISIVSGIMGYFVHKPQFQCLTQDVSVRGMKLLADQPIPEGADVKLWVSLPDVEKSKALKLRGRVCWAATQNVAGKFFAGIYLDARPQRYAAVWAASIRERVRNHFQNAGLQGAPS